MSTAAVAAFSGNPQVGNDVINGLLHNAIVGRVELIGENKLHLDSKRNKAISLGNPIVMKIQSPFDPNEIVGTLTVQPDADLIRHEAEKSAYMLVAWITAIISITAAISTIVIQRTISRPMVNIADQLNTIIPGAAVRLKQEHYHEKNELGSLVHGFNQLLDTMSTTISKERKLRSTMEKMEKRLRQIFDTSTAAIVVIDHFGRITEANPAFLKLVKLHSDIHNATVLTGQSIAKNLFVDSDKVLSMIADVKPGETNGGDFQVNRDHNPEISWIHIDAFVEESDDVKKRIQCVLYDISERKLAEELSNYHALHDHLTGLANRRNSELKMEQIMRSSRQHSQKFALILIDLDGFKQINDSYGHEAGDIVLKEVAKRLSKSMREKDFVSRLGGDEFLIIVTDVHTEEKINHIAQKIIHAVNYPIELSENESCHVGASLGIAFYPDHGSDRDTLTAAADAAMYTTKRSGKNGYSISGQLYIEAAAKKQLKLFS